MCKQAMQASKDDPFFMCMCTLFIRHSRFYTHGSEIFLTVKNVRFNWYRLFNQTSRLSIRSIYIVDKFFGSGT